jgi:hypothetical protein
MTTPPRTHVRLNDPGDLVAAVPHLLGFHPADSLVVVAVRAADGMLARLGLCLRADLPAEEHQRDLAQLLISPLAQSQASGAVLVLVGGGGADPPELLPHRALVWAVGEALAAAGITLLHAVWTAETGGGAQWWCYDEPECCGDVPDPGCSALAAATTAAGVVTFASRAELAALLASDDDGALRRRSEQLSSAAAAAESDCGLDGVAAQRDFLVVREAVREIQAGRLVLDDNLVVRLAIALSDHRVRDACLATAIGEQAAAAEQLWLALTKATPAPERAEPATLLAFAAYLRGDGALAGMALEHAEQAHPGHRLAGLLRRALDAGLSPPRLSVLVTDAAADAAQLLGDGKPE